MRQTDKEYAEALFALSAEEGVLKECHADMESICEIIAECPEYLAFLSSPAIPLSERLAAVDEAFDGRVCDYIVYFIKLLCEKGRAAMLLSIAKEFEALCLARLGKSTAIITSAFELEPDQKKKLLEKLESVHNKAIDPIFEVDPAVLGGIRVEIDGKVYDGTVKARLRNVKDVMMDEQTC